MNKQVFQTGIDTARSIYFALAEKADTVVVKHDSLVYSTNFHQHAETQITLILNGSGTLIVNNYKQRFSRGDIYVIGSNEAHVFLPDKPKDIKHTAPYKADAIHLFFDLHQKSSVLQLAEMKEIRSFLEQPNQSRQLNFSYKPIATQFINQITHTTGLKRLLKLFELLAFFASAKNWKSLSHGLTEHAFASSYNLKDLSRLDYIFNYATSHYNEDIPLEKIASLVNLSTNAFCKYFKKHSLKTWSAFLNEIRIKEVCKRIINNNDSIASVAYSCGFNNLITFNRVFKKLIGMSPSLYIQNFRNENRIDLNQ